MNIDQERSWREAKLTVEQVTDGLGKPIDSGILETVTIMRLLGINTIMSCEGHMDRSLYGPYIMFASSEAMRIKTQLEDPTLEKEENDTLKYEATTLNMRERAKLVAYIDQFYRDRYVPFNQRLIIMSISSLQISYLYCQGAERAYRASERTRQAILSTNKNEMKEFTEFLKRAYVAQK